MAVLNATQLAAARRAIAAELGTVNFTKAEVNAALQAIEDWWESNAASLSTAMNVATTPFTFTVPQKKLIGKVWLLGRFERGN